jgi:hypothetical protein
MSVVRPAVVAGGPKRLDVFARYLTLWVALCIAAGVAVGAVFPGGNWLVSRSAGSGRLPCAMRRNEIRARLTAWLVERQPAETMTRRIP